MKYRFTRIPSVAAATALVLLLFGLPAQAHCDQMDGPVVTDAKEALEAGDVAGVLKWIPAQNEQEVRAAFDKALVVREKGREARELADRFFFETLVRVHRASEGAAFTGLKPADTPVSPAIVRADAALAQGTVDDLATGMADAVEQSIREQYEATAKARAHRDESVEAGRRFVAKYVPFVHYVKRIHETLENGPRSHGHNAKVAGARPSRKE